MDSMQQQIITMQHHDKTDSMKLYKLIKFETINIS